MRYLKVPIIFFSNLLYKLISFLPIFLNTIHLLDYAITVFFVIEILIRFIGEKEKKNFLKDGWNVFDTIIVAISLIPIPNNSSFLVLRLLRIFRVLRLISVIPELKKIKLESVRKRSQLFYAGILLSLLILAIFRPFG